MSSVIFIHLHISHDCFPVTRAELSHCETACTAHKPYNIYYLGLCRKFADLTLVQVNICVPTQNAMGPLQEYLNINIEDYSASHTFAVWNIIGQMRYNMNCFGITGLVASPHAFTHLCLQQQGVIVWLCCCCLWIRRTKRQQNKQNVMFILILIGVKSSGWHRLCTISSVGLLAGDGSLPAPLSWVFKAWNSLFEGLHKTLDQPETVEI